MASHVAAPGRGVVYLTNDHREGEALSATILEVFAEDAVTLRVSDPESDALSFIASPVSFDEGKSPGTWHWPE